MTDQTDNEQNDDTQNDELAMLKQRANLMGITYSNRIGIEALRAKVNAAIEGEPEPENEEGGENAGGDNTAANSPAPVSPNPKNDRMVNPATGLVIPTFERLNGESKAEALARGRHELLAEQMRLIRCRIQNLHPNKADLPGEIFTVGNEFIGNVKKFVPYGEATDEGYHLPFCIYQQLVERRFQNITTTKDRKTGTPVVKTRWTKEFAIEVLPPLTPTELKQLATAQLAAGSIETDGNDGIGETF